MRCWTSPPMIALFLLSSLQFSIALSVDWNRAEITWSTTPQPTASHPVDQASAFITNSPISQPSAISIPAIALTTAAPLEKPSIIALVVGPIIAFVFLGAISFILLTLCGCRRRPSPDPEKSFPQARLGVR
ncbi:hypothetical protein C8J57DRAFT_306237 [Mycena rebaudengoi]|nr:hypothetical protein C8J57DRAFT_306237 [Mycena rebaudengoi]